ncbi:MAG: hypothetical protein JWP44_1487 [Mucilaginibacter sp.]|nr:hypothetical protein [Mucilaginibacter sp.]
MFSRKNITLIYHYVRTMILYRPFLKKAGEKCIVVNPIWFTPKCLTVGNNVTIRNNARIEGVFKYESERYFPEIVIGNDVKIQQNLHLTCALKITIGNNTAIAANVTITDIDHGYEDITMPPEKQPLTVTAVIIGDDCKIYNNAVLLPGTILGKHVIVGANSVVKGQFPDFCLIAGTPAKIIKHYDNDVNRWVKSNPNN